MVVAIEIKSHEERAWQTSEEMADTLGVTVRTVRNMVARGEMDRKRLNGRVYVKRTTAVAAHSWSGETQRVEPMAHPAVVEMVTTLQQQLLVASQDFADRLQNLNDGLIHEKVEKERYLGEVSRLEAANQNVVRDLESERVIYRSEMSNQLRRHNTELTRAVANAATEKSDAKRRFRFTMWSLTSFAAALLVFAFALGASLENMLVLDASRLHFWTASGASDPAGWILMGVVGFASTAGLISWIRKIRR